MQLTLAFIKLGRFQFMRVISAIELNDFFFPRQTDKASMLDEAIEYLKQLQLQVQVCGSL